MIEIADRYAKEHGKIIYDAQLDIVYNDKMDKDRLAVFLRHMMVNRSVNAPPRVAMPTEKNDCFTCSSDRWWRNRIGFIGFAEVLMGKMCGRFFLDNKKMSN